MPNPPSWLKCENCLWWAFSNEITYYRSTDLEKQEIVGCINPDASPQLHTCQYRCPLYICRRCLKSLVDIVASSPNIENHNLCKRVGKGKNITYNSGFLAINDE